MLLTSWLTRQRNALRTRRRSRLTPPHRSHRQSILNANTAPKLEPLEDRLVLSAMTMTFDSGTTASTSHEEAGMIAATLDLGDQILIQDFDNAGDGDLELRVNQNIFGPVTFSLANGGPFTPTTLEVVLVQVNAEMTLTSSTGSTINVTSEGTVNFPAAGWTNISSFSASVINAAIGLDDLVFEPGTFAADDDIGVIDDTTPVSIDVLANDTVQTGGTISITTVSTPGRGTAVIDDNSTPGDTTDDFIVYTPDPGASGTDSFTYTISDGLGDTSTATVDLAINFVNDGPTLDLNGTDDAGEDFATLFTGAATPITDTDALLEDLDGGVLVGASENVGEVFVVNEAGEVVQVDPDDGTQTLISTGTAISSARNLAIDDFTGDIYVADLTGHEIVRVDPATGVETVIASGLGSPWGIVVDDDGDLIVTDRTTAELIRIDPATGTSTLIAGSIRGFGVALEEDGNIVVAAQRDLFRVDPVSGAVTTIANGFASAYDVVVESDGNIIVSDINAGTIIRVDPVTGAQTVLASNSTPGTRVAIDLMVDGSIVVTNRNGAPDHIGVINAVDGSTTTLSSGGFLLTNWGIDVQEQAFKTGVDNIASMTVTITDLRDGADEVLAADTSGTDISASYDSNTGVLSLTGNDELADYLSVLRTITYNHTGGSISGATRTISFVANDGELDSNVATTVITVDTNDVPTADAGGPYNVDEGSTVTLDASDSSDPDQSTATLGFQWDLDGDGVFGETGAAAARGDETGISPTFDAAGMDGPTSVTVSLIVTDDEGETDTDTATINVRNVAPSVSVSSSTLSVDEGQTATHSGTWSDPVDTVTLTASIGTITQNADGTWDWSFDTLDGPDSHTVRVTATDSDGASTDTRFILTVNNVAPSVGNDGDVTVDEGATATNAGSWSDPGDDIVTLTSSIGTVTRNADGTWNWSFDTLDGPDDSQTVTVTATDSDGASSTTTFDLTVNNVAPSVGSAGDVTADEGSTATNTGTWSDPGDDSVSLTASIGTVTQNANGTWSWSFDTLDGPDDSQTVTITATDSDGASSSTAFDLTVDNVAPILSNNGDVTVGEGATATNTGTWSDPGVDTVTLTASIGTVTQNGDGTWDWSFDTLDGPDDSQTVTITATDSDGASSTTTFDLTVNNVAPAVSNAGDVTVDEGTTATNTGTWSDPGVDTVTLTASIGSLTQNANGTWSWSFDTLDGPDDSQTVTITATDSDGASSSTTFDLKVDNVAPSVGNDGDVTADEGQTATNSGTWSDPGVDVVTLSASIGTVTRNGDGTWDWSFDTLDGPDDSQTVTITATDSDGTSSSTTTFDLTVNNVAPSVGSAGDVTADEGSTATNTGTWSDPGDDTVTLTASIGTVTQNGDGTWNWSFDTLDGPDDSQTVTITATDSDGASSSTTFDLTVDNVAPSVSSAGDVTVDEGSTATNTGTWSDPGVDTVTLTASIGSLTQNASGTWSWSFDTLDGPDDSQTVTITATDSDGASSSTTFELTVDNVAPNVGNDGDVSANVGETPTNTGTWSDPGVDTVTLTASVGTVTQNANGTWSWTLGETVDPADSQVVTITATDSDGASSTTSFELTVAGENEPPVITSLESSHQDTCGASDDGEVTVTGEFFDPDLLDTHIVLIDWGDGGDIDEITIAQGDRIFVGVHEYEFGGIYTVTVTVVDSHDNESESETITASVQGVGMVNGTLYIIGTDGRDHVNVKYKRWKDQLKVDAKLNQGRHRRRIRRTFKASEVDQIVAYMCGGNDYYNGGVGACNWWNTTTIPQIVLGGDGNDILKGGGGNDVLSGGDGCDLLFGRGGHDILIGGDHWDCMHGGWGCDLLIGGIAENQENVDALAAASAAWSSGQVEEALLELGEITDDNKRDWLHGGPGWDTLISGHRDRRRW